jgi:hypothetical protein
VQFFPWLCNQAERLDAIGVIAGIALSDKRFPRKSQRLYVFLRHFDSNAKLTAVQRKRCRDAIKQAHAEWRNVRAAERPDTNKRRLTTLLHKESL